MNPLIEPEDPDCRVHATWLAQVSKAGDSCWLRKLAASILLLMRRLARSV
jgi:hypothetical protein